MRLCVVLLIILHVNEELPRTALLEEAHQVGLQGFDIRCGDFVDLSSAAASPMQARKILHRSAWMLVARLDGSHTSRCNARPN